MRNYNITEKKEATLAALEIQVLDARHDVDQFQAMVSSLTEKAEIFQRLLEAAQVNKESALKNKNSLDEIIGYARNLKENSGNKFNQVVLADEKTKKVTALLKKVTDEIIYSGELVNKFMNVVVRKKTQNPLISDDLVNATVSAAKDANNAVALSLVALKSTLTTQTSLIETTAIASVEYKYTQKLSEMLTEIRGNDEPGMSDKKSLKRFIDAAFTSAENTYEQALEANKKSVAELSEARLLLDKATIKLNSIQSELQAAKAAILGA